MPLEATISQPTTTQLLLPPSGQKTTPRLARTADSNTLADIWRQREELLPGSLSIFTSVFSATDSKTFIYWYRVIFGFILYFFLSPNFSPHFQIVYQTHGTST